jgi:PPOX class probable F420-dependent enzyme
MTNRRADIAMSDREVADYLAHARVVNVATVNRDGSIHLVPMYVVLDHGEVCFWTYSKSQKIANLTRDDRVTLLAEDGDTYGELRGVQIVGRAVIVAEPDEVQRIGWEVARRQGTADTPAARVGVVHMGAKRVAVRVRPERVVSWDHRKAADRP